MSAVLSPPQPTLRERRYMREAARYDRAIQAILRAARIADDSRRKLDRWDRENLRRPNGTMTGEEAVKAIGGKRTLTGSCANVCVNCSGTGLVRIEGEGNEIAGTAKCGVCS